MLFIPCRDAPPFGCLQRVAPVSSLILSSDASVPPSRATADVPVAVLLVLCAKHAGPFLHPVCAFFRSGVPSMLSRFPCVIRLSVPSMLPRFLLFARNPPCFISLRRAKCADAFSSSGRSIPAYLCQVYWRISPCFRAFYFVSYCFLCHLCWRILCVPGRSPPCVFSYLRQVCCCISVFFGRIFPC